MESLEKESKAPINFPSIAIRKKIEEMNGNDILKLTAKEVETLLRERIFLFIQEYFDGTLVFNNVNCSNSSISTSSSTSTSTSAPSFLSQLPSNKPMLFHIPPVNPTTGEKLSVANVFGLMELHKSTLFIKEWGFQQVSLEDVFTKVVKNNEQ